MNSWVKSSRQLNVPKLCSVTAYVGVEKVLKIKEGGTLVVSTAAGAVGSVVCQLGKIKG